MILGNGFCVGIFSLSPTKVVGHLKRRDCIMYYDTPNFTTVDTYT